MNVGVYKLPACWASYLINGDASGISEREKREADQFLDANDLDPPVSCSENSWFSWSNDANTKGGDVMHFTFHIKDSTFSMKGERE